MSVIVASSPALAFPGAVAGVEGSPDEGVAWHYGDPFGEQRAAAEHVAVIDRSHRSVLAITGDDRLTWLHTISSQDVANLADGDSTENLDLDGNGRVLHHFVLTELDKTVWIDTERAGGPSLLKFLQQMVFWSKASPRDANTELAVLTLMGPDVATLLPTLGTESLPEPNRALALPGGGFIRAMPRGAFDLLIPRAQLSEIWDALVAAGARPAGMWAAEALRVAAVQPRVGLDTDDRTIPHEVGWIGSAVHLDKGCYRGQETVARVHNLGKPPRHLVLLHLDGSADGRPEPGDAVTLPDGRDVGRLGTVVDHYELGPIALALVKRSVPADTALTTGPCAASIDPDSVPHHDEPQAGRLAVDRLRGR